MAATSGMGGGMQGRFLGNSGELNPEIWDAANVRFCLEPIEAPASFLSHSIARNNLQPGRTSPEFALQGQKSSEFNEHCSETRLPNL